VTTALLIGLALLAGVVLGVVALIVVERHAVGPRW
jgi:hypothetical protein